MAGAVIRPLTGVINGVNREFRTPVPYIPGSVQVWLNGQLYRQDLADGWEERGSDRIELKQAPAPGDVVQAFFRYA